MIVFILSYIPLSYKNYRSTHTIELLDVSFYSKIVAKTAEIP